MSYKLGSLFDGSGGFPLSGTLCGIEPCWAAEVEPYPIAVTRTRFPNMKHLGDISKVNGAEIEPVDVITFGSPCQDLSVAGKRAGLKHEANGDEETTRSGLFMEAVRIIKEMRLATNGQYPRFALWENVPGAFSSNNGNDFRVVCEELIKIVEPAASMPPVPSNGWAYADSYVGDGWSLAYRTFDAQYWGVPQRRRRIHLVADFRGERAREVLFERQGVRGYFETGRTPWQGVAHDAEDCAGTANREGEGEEATGGRGLDAVGFDAYNQAVTGNISKPLTAAASDADHVPVVYVIDQGGGKSGANVHNDLSPTLTCTHGGEPAVVYSIENHPADSRVGIDESGKVQTLTSRMGTGGGNVPMVMEPKVFESHPMDSRIKELDGVSPTVSAKWHKGAADTPLVCETTTIDIDRHTIAYGLETFHCTAEEETVPTLKARDWKDPNVVCYGIDCRNMNEYLELYPTLQAKPNGGQSLNFSGALRTQHIVRRLTPTECARLQGFADRWGDIEKKDSLTPEEFRFWHDVRNTHAAINGKKVQEYTEVQILTWYNKLHTDSAEYKMWGNGIALPPALYCMQGIVDAMNKEEDGEEWLL